MQALFRFLIGIVFLGSANLAQAQFEGINSFFNDTALIAKVKRHKIRSAQEVVLQNGKTQLLKKYYFDHNGKVCDMYTFSGTGVSRKHFEYDKNGFVTLEQYYEDGDTTKISSSQSMQYNASGQLLSKKNNYTLDNKQVNEIEFISKPILSTSTKTIIEAQEFYRANKTARLKFIDSIVGADQYTCSYRFKEGDADEKGRIHGKKTIERSHKQGAVTFSDEVEYEVYGNTESPKDIKSSYYEYDAKKRMLEFGEINYEEVYADFLQRHPDNFNPYQVSPLFVAAVFKNEITGQKRPDAKFTYNQKGQLLEKLFYGIIYSFEYDAIGNTIAYTTKAENADYGKSNFKLFYSEMGLVSKIISESTPPEGSGAAAERQELTYIYGH
jgi:hypothetical protein